MALALRKRQRSISIQSEKSNKTKLKKPKTIINREECKLRCSLRLKNKIQNNKGDFLDIPSKKSSEKILLERKPSEESVIYVKTTRLSDITIIDLTASTSSLGTVSCVSDFRLNRKKRLFCYKKRKNVGKSMSLLTLRRRNSSSTTSTYSSRSSLSKECSNSKVHSEVVWQLKKSYNLSLRLQNRLRSQSKKNPDETNENTQNDCPDNVQEKSKKELVTLYNSQQ